MRRSYLALDQFASSANIISGPNAPGAAEKIEVFSYLRTFLNILKQLKHLKLCKVLIKVQTNLAFD